MVKIGISACLGFDDCRYDGKRFKNFDVEEIRLFLKRELNVEEIDFIPVCPEQLGGLSTPRTPSEIIGGDGTDIILGKAKVINKDRIDVTENFIRGAEQVLKLANKYNIKVFVLKENSPSCGVNSIYSGDFDGNKKSGQGVTTALLEKYKIRVFSDDMILMDRIFI